MSDKMSLDGVLQMLATGQTAIQAELQAMRGEITSIRTGMAGLRADMTSIHTETAGLRSEMTSIHTEMAGLRSDMTSVRTGMADMEQRLTGNLVKTRADIMERVDRLSDEVTGFRQDVAGNYTITMDAQRLAENVQQDLTALRQQVRQQGERLLTLSAQVAEIRRSH